MARNLHLKSYSLSFYLINFFYFFFAISLFAESPFDSITAELKAIANRAEQAQKKAEDLKVWEDRQRQEIVGVEKQLSELIQREEKLGAELDQISIDMVLIKEEVKQLYKEEAVLLDRRKRRLIAVEAIEPADMFVKLISVETSGFDEHIATLSASIQRGDDLLAAELRSVRSELSKRADSIAKLYKDQRLVHKQMREERQQIALLLGKKQQLQSDIAAQRKVREEQALKLNGEVLKLESIKQELFEKGLSTKDSDFKGDTKDSLAGAVVEHNHLNTPLFKNGSLKWPLYGSTKKQFGVEAIGKGGLKNGLLIGVEKSSEGGISSVKAVEMGVIGFVGQIPFYGLSVIISHGPSEYSLYGNLASTKVNPSDEVKAGEPIGVINPPDGQLYFELRKGNKSVNPATFLQKRPSK